MARCDRLHDLDSENTTRHAEVPGPSGLGGRLAGASLGLVHCAMVSVKHGQGRGVQFSSLRSPASTIHGLSRDLSGNDVSTWRAGHNST